MTTQRVLETVKDCYGEETPVAVLYEEGGLLYMYAIALKPIIWATGV